MFSLQRSMLALQIFVYFFFEDHIIYMNKNNLKQEATDLKSTISDFMYKAEIEDELNFSKMKQIMSRISVMCDKIKESNDIEEK